MILTQRYADIWDNLSLEWGARFSNSTKLEHTRDASVSLKECPKCGLQHFAPATAGTATFYAELTSSSRNYYSDNKWEFDLVKDLLRKDHKLLDVACGKGAFLRAAAPSVSEVVGVDTNPDVTLAKGAVRIVNESIEDFAIGHDGYFDVVTAFQVIEHLDQVMPFVVAAYKCVRPGGFLALSVPNRERRRDLGFGSLDYPPHHISRWHERQLVWIAETLGSRSSVVSKQPLSRTQTTEALRNKELLEILPIDFWGRHALIKAVSRLALTFPVSLVWRAFGASSRLNMVGLSMLILIEKSEEVPCAASLAK